MKLTISIEMEQYQDGTVEVASAVNPHGQPPDTKLTKGMALLVTCLAAGLEAGVEAFQARSPGLHITHRDGLMEFKRV